MLTGGDVVVKAPKTTNVDTARVATDTPSGMGPRLDILEVNLEPPKTFVFHATSSFQAPSHPVQ